MGPKAQGRYVPDPDMSSDWVACERFLDRESLRATLERAVKRREDDPLIAVSRVVRHYCAALTCVAVTGLANGVGVDLTPVWCAVTFKGTVPGRIALVPRYRARYVLRCSDRPTNWPVPGPAVATVEQLREHVWTGLYAHHLAPLFAQVTGLTEAPEDLLWTHAADRVRVMMDAAIAYLPRGRASAVITECQALLAAGSLPGWDDNPLQRPALTEDMPGQGIPWLPEPREHTDLPSLPHPSRIGHEE